MPATDSGRRCANNHPMSDILHKIIAVKYVEIALAMKKLPQPSGRHCAA